MSTARQDGKFCQLTCLFLFPHLFLAKVPRKNGLARNVQQVSEQDCGLQESILTILCLEVAVLKNPAFGRLLNFLAVESKHLVIILNSKRNTEKF